MDYVKRMAFVVALVAGLCGGAWAQGWGHRAQNTQTWRNSAPAHERASVTNHSWGSHNNTAAVPYRNGRWGYQNNTATVPYRTGDWAYRNNPNYQYRNGQWGYAPNRTWGTYYPYGNYGYYPYPTTGGYYPYPTTGGYYPYPATGSYYPGGWGGYGSSGAYGYPGSVSGIYASEYQRGYRDGIQYGRAARGTGHAYHPAQQAAYKHGDQGYRQGFAVGYQRGYMGRF